LHAQRGDAVGLAAWHTVLGEGKDRSVRRRAANGGDDARLTGPLDGEQHWLVAGTKGASGERIPLPGPRQRLAPPPAGPGAGSRARDQIEGGQPRLTRVGDQAPEKVVRADQNGSHDPPRSMILRGG